MDNSESIPVDPAELDAMMKEEMEMSMSDMDW